MKKTIRSIFRLAVTLLLVGGWALAGSALYVVWSGHKLVVIPKDHIGFHDTYANTSAWSADDIAAHPSLCSRLVATGHSDALAGAFKDATGDELTAKISDAIAKGPATTQPTAPSITDRVQQAVHRVSASVGH